MSNDYTAEHYGVDVDPEDLPFETNKERLDRLANEAPEPYWVGGQYVEPSEVIDYEDLPFEDEGERAERLRLDRLNDVCLCNHRRSLHVTQLESGAAMCLQCFIGSSGMNEARLKAKHVFDDGTVSGPWPPDLANEQRLNMQREHC